MVVYRYLGSDTTDSTGVAEYSYTGTGKGEIQVIASTDRPISDSSLQSETYSILDCLMYDTTEYSSTGTGSAKSDITNEVSWDNTIDWSFTAEIKVSGPSCRIEITPPTYMRTRHLGIGKNTQSRLTTYVGRATSGESAVTSTLEIENDVYYPIKIEKQGTTVSFYFNDELVRTDDEIASTWIGDFDSERVLLTSWGNDRSTIYIKNMQVLPI